MCAQIYEKPSEKVVILSSREAIQRPLDFSTWSEIRLGMFFSMTTVGSDNTAVAAETLAIVSPNDYITYGLKNSNNTNVPGVSGSRFIGIGTTSGNSLLALGDIGGFNTFHAQGFEGTTLIENASTMHPGIMFFPSPTPSTAYSGVFILKLVLANRGLSSQTVTATAAQQSGVAGGTYSTDELLIEMNNFIVPGATRTFNWNDGVSAYDIPDAFYIRLPFYTARMRISAMYAKRYA